MMKYVLLFTALFSVSCSHITPVEQQLLDCGSAAVHQQLTNPGPNGGPSVMTQIMTLMSSGQVDWQAGLDSLLSAAGSSVICGVQAVIGDLEKQQTRVSGEEVTLIRAHSWVSVDARYKLVKNAPASTAPYKK